ncbi:MAG TPA: SNF2-related protein [Kiritimatiellia bacterium]|nr:MAG: ATP-dependent helicase HepA [Verrucomicrobia bacterium ADurb.Bin018]HOE01284.1 SNF2-related protein [Kiritimatiellia bacterium]HOE37493.1 SNF2-related protein [Kiritimatiellia bacterium]HOR74920.1 SNF2-related protein [Kiritimatiellia bacterium]HPK69860.1 SNF2-related protein [Kiritimatiellia bacterium]
MKLPLTVKMLQDWGGPTTFRDGRSLFERGLVMDATVGEDQRIQGTISWGSRSIKTGARILPDHSCENQCPCRDNVERGVVCSHVIALGLALLARHHDPDRERKRLEEERHAQRLRQAATEFFKRAPSGAPGAVNCAVRLELPEGWREAAPGGQIPVRLGLVMSGAVVPMTQISREITLGLTPQDEAVLFVLEEIVGGALPDELLVGTADFINLLQLHSGRALHAAAGAELPVNATPVQSMLRVDLDHENGELLLTAHTELPFTRGAEIPTYLVAGRAGWVFGGGNFWPLARLLPVPLWALYAQQVVIPRPDVPRFLREEMPGLNGHIRVEAEVKADVFSFEPETPELRLDVQGSPASLTVKLIAVYGDVELVAGKTAARGSFAHPDPEDILRYTVRNPQVEQEALAVLARYGLTGPAGDALNGVVGSRAVLNFIGSAIPALRRKGWRVLWHGRIQAAVENAVFATPVVSISPERGAESWFEVRFDYDAGEAGGLTSAEIQRALLKGEAFVERGGRTILLDTDAIRALHSVFSDCASGAGRQPGSFRLAPVYAAYAASALQALDGVDVEAPPAWLAAAAQNNRLEPVEGEPLDPMFERVLRPYQKEGVHWLRFLQRNRFGGILADEMGLGKTLQTLVWLAMATAERASSERKPALLVCPTSLVDNWAAEAARFTPWLKVGTMTGADRHERWEEARNLDILVTSYALLRRDIALHEQMPYFAVVLDEAQHIKNQSTQNAQAAKRLHAEHRLVLTGTPIENGVADLWSIMDFLMPGYLGSRESFRANIEQAIQHGGAEGELAQWKLRRKLRPFLLRRMKRDVAKELPPKIERVAACALSNDQKKVYTALLENSRQKIVELVAAQGFLRAKFEILNTLLRLRQACCHLDLLKLPDLQAREPSAKLELFFELLDEALDAGHRVLVFSQFVSMLTILRRELERRKLRYCYLDGATTERLKIVQEFNRDAAIPLFLISLKAGGTGLNLTGADMVIHFDPWWNPAVENQATDRAYRIGQKRTVYSVKLIAQDSIEERVLALQRKKQKLYDATLEDGDDATDIHNLTWEDVQELLSL